MTQKVTSSGLTVVAAFTLLLEKPGETKNDSRCCQGPVLYKNRVLIRLLLLLLFVQSIFLCSYVEGTLLSFEKPKQMFLKGVILDLFFLFYVIIVHFVMIFFFLLCFLTFSILGIFFIREAKYTV